LTSKKGAGGIRTAARGSCATPQARRSTRRPRHADWGARTSAATVKLETRHKRQSPLLPASVVFYHVHWKSFQFSMTMARASANGSVRVPSHGWSD